MKLTVFIFLISLSAMAKDQLLGQYCEELNGKVVSSYQCPKSGLNIPFNFCLYTNNFGDKQFFDGCTGPTGGHSDLFYPHCIKHDLCYHHEPSSNGKTQRTCDQELYDGLKLSCEKAENKKKCLSWAKRMFNAVKYFGKLAYNCADYKGTY